MKSLKLVLVMVMAVVFIVSCAAPKTKPLAQVSTGPRIQLEINAGAKWTHPHTFFIAPTTVTPQFAVWLLAADGSNLGTVFVTEKAANSSWIGGVARPESLPLWYHAGAAQVTSTPTNEIDARAGATPEAGFNAILALPADSWGKVAKVRLEINSSFDGPAGQSEKASVNGNPSVLYEGVIDANAASSNDWVDLKAVGTGSLDGSDGLVHALDLAGDAVEMIQSVRIRILN